MKHQKVNWSSEWELISILDWANNCKDPAAVARRCILLVGKDGWERLKKFVREKYTELNRAIEQYETVESERLDIGSDDGFSDVLHHVIGLGQAEFERCLKNPTLVEARYNARKYSESFAYVFLEPDPERTPEDTKKDVATLEEEANNLVKQLTDLARHLETIQCKMMELTNRVRVVKEDLAK